MRFKILQLVALVIGITLLLAYQNCGGFEVNSVESYDSSQASSDGGAIPSFKHTSAEPFQMHLSPRGIVNKNSFTFAFTITPAIDFKNNQLVCVINNVETSCASLENEMIEGAGFTQINLTIPNLNDGQQMVSFKNASVAPAALLFSIGFPVDTTGPTITIVPRFTINTAANDAAFEIGATDSNSVTEIQCRIDNAPYVLCQGPQTFANLSVGNHTFQAIAKDQVGNVSDPATFSFSILPPPANFLDFASKPAVVTGASSAAFAFEVGTDISSVHCALDGQPATSCRTGITYNNLALGNHTLAVTGKNAGGTDIATLSYSWRIVQAPVFANFEIDRVVFDPGTSTYKNVVSATDATFYRWEIPGIATPPVTAVGEYNFTVSRAEVERVVPFCVVAGNIVGETRACGTLTFSLFGKSSGGSIVFDGNTVGNVASAANFRPIGVRFAADGQYVYSGISSRIAQSGEVKVLALYYIAINGQIFDWYSTSRYSSTTSAAQYRLLENATVANWSLIATDEKLSFQSASRLSKSGSSVYYKGTVVPNIDAASVAALPAKTSMIRAIKDTNTVTIISSSSSDTYAFQLSELAQADAPTFQFLSGMYFYDKTNLFYVSTSVVTQPANTANLKAHGNYWVSDGTAVFYQGNPIAGLTGTVESFNGYYIFAGGKVAHLGTLVSGVASAGFKPIVQDSLSDYDAIISGGKVYFYSVKANTLTEFVGADPATIKTLGVSFRVTGYWVDNNQSWYVSVNLSTNALMVLDMGINPTTTTLTTLGSRIAKTSQTVYVAGVASTAVLDPASFALISGDWYKDNSAIYNVTYNAPLVRVDVPLAGFETLGFSPGYARNCSVNKVFYNTTLLSASCSTFRVDTTGWYARDNVSCWRMGQYIGPASTSGCSSIP